LLFYFVYGLLETMATSNVKPAEQAISPANRVGRDEMNLAEFPISLLADRVQAGQKTLYFEDEHGRLTVTGSDAYGLPTANDTDVIVALIYLTKKKNDFTNEKVNFSRYELINILGWIDEGKSYKRLDLSLNRWSGILLVYDKCWWNNKLKCYTSAKMHIIENVEIIDSDARRKSHLAGQSDLPLSNFIWDRKFIESCQADNLRQLNLDTYFSLKSAVAKRLYRFLGKRFYLQGDWTFDLNEIAFDRVGLSRSYADAGKIKEKLQPAIEELESIGFLRPLTSEKRYKRIDRGKWTIRLTRQSPTLVSPPSTAPVAAPSLLIAELTSRGVTKKTAVDLVSRHAAEAIAVKIEEFDYLVRKQDKKISKSPAGYLVKSINDDYGQPKGFTSKADCDRQAAANRQKEEDAAASRRQQRERDAAEKAERKAVTAYWESLTAEQQAEHEAAAIAQADDEQLKLIEPGPVKKFGMTVIRDSYTRKLLQAQGKLPPTQE
jgi:hypothetical protein